MTEANDTKVRNDNTEAHKEGSMVKGGAPDPPRLKLFRSGWEVKHRVAIYNKDNK